MIGTIWSTKAKITIDFTIITSVLSIRRPPRRGSRSRAGATSTGPSGSTPRRGEEHAAGRHAGAHARGGLRPLARHRELDLVARARRPARARPPARARRAAWAPRKPSDARVLDLAAGPEGGRGREPQAPAGAGGGVSSGSVGELLERRAREAASRSCQRTPRPPISSSVRPAVEGHGRGHLGGHLRERTAAPRRLRAARRARPARCQPGRTSPACPSAWRSRCMRPSGCVTVPSFSA